MKVMGMSVHVKFPMPTKLQEWCSGVSIRLNRLTDREKKQLLLGFILLTVTLFTGMLIGGITRGHSAGLQLQDWKPPLVYYDSVLHDAMTRQFYEFE